MSKRYLIKSTRGLGFGEIYLIQSETEKTYSCLIRSWNGDFSGRPWRINKSDAIAVLDSLDEAIARLKLASKLSDARYDKTRPLRAQIQKIEDETADRIAAALRGEL